MADKNFLRKLMEKAAATPQAQRQAPVLHLTAPKLLACALVGLCAVAWAFFMGFMVGCGQSPTKEIHAMTGMLEPQPDKSSPTLPDAANADSVTPQANAQDTPASGPIPPASANSAENSALAATPVAVAAVQATQPRNAKPAARQAGPTPQRQPQTNTSAPKPASQKAAQPEQQYDYTFQVSAVKSQNDAGRLIKQLAAKGVKATVNKSGKVWLVMVSLRGGATDVEKFNNTLTSLRLGKPLRLSRNPVQNPAPKRGHNK